jgi:hypothetical protein
MRSVTTYLRKMLRLVRAPPDLFELHSVMLSVRLASGEEIFEFMDRRPPGLMRNAILKESAMTTRRCNLLMGGLLILSFSSAAHAQGTIQNTYTAPNWGQAGSNSWGTQSGNIGQGGWQYDRMPQANQPSNNSAYPNATSRPFGSTSGNRNPLTIRGRAF